MTTPPPRLFLAGAAPASNLFYGIGDGNVFTVEVDGDSAVIKEPTLSDARFTGASDVTAAPNGDIYVRVFVGFALPFIDGWIDVQE